jgi:mannose/fructose/N-acetylgalactosamine-specific phosphotransferase system component IIC
MIFTQEVRWSLTDFVVMGGMLIALGWASHLVFLSSRAPKIKAALVAGFTIVFLLVWALLAIGISDSETTSTSINHMNKGLLIS